MSEGDRRRELVSGLLAKLSKTRTEWDHHSRFCERVHLCLISARLGCGIRAMILPVSGEMYRDRRDLVQRHAAESFRHSNRVWLDGMRMAGPTGRLPL